MLLMSVSALDVKVYEDDSDTSETLIECNLWYHLECTDFNIQDIDKELPNKNNKKQTLIL